MFAAVALHKLEFEFSDLGLGGQAVMGQEISEEEVSLIQDIQLPEEEMNGSTKDTEALEVSEGK